MKTTTEAESHGSTPAAGGGAPRQAHRAGSRPFSKDRLLSFSDGVFSIAVTLLVLELHIPGARTLEEFNAQVAALWPSFASYLLSFMVAGAYWLAYHRMMAHLRTTDARLARLNLLLLFFVSLQPFPTALLGRYTLYPLAITIYACVLSATGLLLVAMWVYATRAGHLAEHVTPALRRYLMGRMVINPVIFMSSIPVAFINPAWAVRLWILAVPAFVALERTLGRQVREDEAALPSQ